MTACVSFIIVLRSLFGMAFLFFFFFLFPLYFPFLSKHHSEVIVVDLSLPFENIRDLHSPFQFPVDFFSKILRKPVCDL